jgi:hypothetical protein
MLSKVRDFSRSLSITPQVDSFSEIFPHLSWLLILPPFTTKKGSQAREERIGERDQ